MKALSKVSARVKFVGVLVAGVFVVAVGSTMIQASLAEPEIEISFSHYTTNQNARYAIVEIRNTGSAPAQYRGYSKESPAADLVHRDSAGEWQGRILRCGTGLVDCSLMPGEAIRTTNYVSGVGEWKLGLHYWKARFIDGLPIRVRFQLSFLPQSKTYRTTWSAVQSGFATELVAPPVEELAVVE
jgi:hypothetical protein